MKLCHQPVLAVVFGSLSLALCANGEGVNKKVTENTWKSSVANGEWVSGDNWNKEGYPFASDSAAGFYGNSNHNELDVTVRLPDETNSINRLHVLHRYPSSFVFDGRGRNFSMGALGEDDLPRGSQKTTTKPDDVDGGSFYPLNIMSEVASDSTAVKISKASGDGRSAVFDWRNALMRTFSPSPKDVSVEFLGGTFDFNVDNCKNWNLEFSSSGLSHSRMLVSNSTVKCAVFAAPCNATNSTLVIDEGGELVSNGKFEFGYNNSMQYIGTNTVIVKNGGKIKFDNGGVFVNSFGFYVGSEAALCRRQEFYLSGAGSCIDLGQMAQAYFIGNTLLDVSDGASLVLPGKSALSYSAALGHRPEVSELRLSGDDSRIFISTNIVTGKQTDMGYLSVGTVNFVSNRIVVTGGKILPYNPDGTAAIALLLSTAVSADSVFELHGGDVEFWVDNAVNRDTSCYVRLGPGDALFSISGGRMKCGDFYVGAGMPAAETAENTLSHVHELRMTGGEVNCNRLYLGPSDGANKSFWHSDARVVLDGGVIVAKQAYLNHPSNCVGRLWANGGTIRAKQNSVDLIFDFTTAELGPKGLTIDTAGFNAVSVSQSFSDKPGEKGTLRFAGGGTVTFKPAYYHCASTTLVEQATKLCISTNMTLASTLVVDGGTLSLAGAPSQMTLDGFIGRSGMLIVDPGDKIHLRTSMLEIGDFTLKFNSKPAAGSVYDVFVFDGDIANNANLRSVMRNLKVENAPDGQYGAFTAVYDEENNRTVMKMTCTSPLSAPLGEDSQTVWTGSEWNAEGCWSAGKPSRDKVAVFGGNEPLQVAVPGLQEVGAMKFSEASYVLSGEGATLEFSGIRGGSFIEVASGVQKIDVPMILWHTVPVSVAEGASIMFNESITDGGIAKTGKGRLELLAPNDFNYDIYIGGGLNTFADANSLGFGSNKANITEDTAVFTNAVDGSEMTVKTPVRLNSSLSPTNAIIVKTDSDVVFEDFAVSSGAFIKRGKGKMTIVSSPESPMTYSGGYGVGSADGNFNLAAGTSPIAFAADGTAPSIEDHQYTGFNVAEGELVVRGTSESSAVTLKTALMVGLEVAGSPDGYAQPMLTVDGIKLSHGNGSGHWAVGHHVAKEGNAVTRPTLCIINGGEVSCGNLRVGQESNNSPGAFPTVAATNGEVKAANALRFYTAGRTIDKAGVLLRFKDSLCAVTGTGGSHHGIILGGTIDADFDNSFFGGTKQNARIEMGGSISGELRFRNGSTFAVDTFKQIVDTSANQITFAFDDAVWQYGTDDYLLEYLPSGKGNGLRPTHHIEMRGTGVILKPAVGKTFTTEVKFEGEGGMVCDGEGTVKFKDDALAFSGLLDIRKGTVDLSESAKLSSLSVRGPGTLKGGNVDVLTIRPQSSGSEIAGAPILDGINAGRVIVDFAAGEPMDLNGFEKVCVATFGGDVSKWKVSGTGHSHPIAVFEKTVDGKVMLTLRERKPLKIIVR